MGMKLRTLKRRDGVSAIIPGIVFRFGPALSYEFFLLLPGDQLGSGLGGLQLVLQLPVLVLKVADLLSHLRGASDLLLEGKQLDGMSAVLAMPGGLDAPKSV